MPEVVQKILYFIPLTHASSVIRSSAYGKSPDPVSLVILLTLGALFFVMAFKVVHMARD